MALTQKKAQGFKLEKPENLTTQAVERGRQIRMENTRTHKANVQAMELAQLYRQKGLTYGQIAERLNQMHHLTRRDKSFEGKAVYRLLHR